MRKQRKTMKKQMKIIYLYIKQINIFTNNNNNNIDIFCKKKK